jgi:hypothetical protein
MNSGVITGFHCEVETALACEGTDIAELAKWRKQLRARGLVGQEPGRYGGLGYGNLSKRLEDETILITGSQTGHLEELTSAHFARILDFDPDRNWIRSRGLIGPSSETMTHLAIYRSDAEALFVFHTHSPQIWQARAALDLPITDPRFECGTLGLFCAVLELLRDPDRCRQGILAMGGHRDGIMSWGRTADQAGGVLMDCLAACAGRRGFAETH